MDRLRCSLSRTTITPSLSLLLFSLLLFLCNIPNLASAAAGFNNLSTITFSEGYNPLFSDFNILRSSDDRTVSLLLNRLFGSGFISPDYYNYGLFSAKIKLRSNYSAGIVVAFYTSNGDVFEKTHDELDLEFLPKSSIVTPFSGPPNPSCKLFISFSFFFSFPGKF
ncbi:probable xyloglucan endotransglucosylase/hydrolase protein 30 [Camellia sinensis]|uniref:probable xyloglucan endotransglucosylase/hydrolase protein 30 n=1 Tax=Camellia sinensis TaxID=4442 RepID=UPI00103685D3|nr:probable xyloglucan endotransglucosylase/hydrolase protein 30 [Camellia sinensis]